MNVLSRVTVAYCHVCAGYTNLKVGFYLAKYFFYILKKHNNFIF